MFRRTASRVPRPAVGILLAVLGFQVAASGVLPSCAPRDETQLAGHAPAAIFTVPSTPVSLELEDGDAGSGSTASASRADARSLPTSDSPCAEVSTPWRADHALTRAGRLSSPSTAPPLSGA